MVQQMTRKEKKKNEICYMIDTMRVFVFISREQVININQYLEQGVTKECNVNEGYHHDCHVDKTGKNLIVELTQPSQPTSARSL